MEPNRLPKTKVPTFDLAEVIVGVIRILCVRNDARVMSDSAQLFMMNLKGHIEILDNDSGWIHGYFIENRGSVQAGKTGNNGRYACELPGLSELHQSLT